jgi:hypothetical protein
MFLNGFKDRFALKSKRLIGSFKAIHKTEFPENVLRNRAGCFNDTGFVTFPYTILQTGLNQILSYIFARLPMIYREQEKVKSLWKIQDAL